MCDDPPRSVLLVKAWVTNADKGRMDLSKVLDDVYDTEKRPTPRADAAPAWADEQKLDEVFAQWTPGPPADAPAAEREMAESLGDKAAPTLDDETAVTIARILGGSDVDPEPVVFPAVEAGPDPIAAAVYAELPDFGTEPVGPARWLRGDDDVQFGGRSQGRRFGRRG